MKKTTTAASVNTRVRTSTSSARVVKTTTRKRIPAAQSIEYVLPLGNDGWVVKNNLTTTFTAITDSKKEAISIAREIAKTKRIELIVQGRNGQVLLRENYQS